MSDLAYFEYALVLPEERYLIEVQTRKPDSGELLAQEEIEGIAKECLVSPLEDRSAELMPQSKYRFAESVSRPWQAPQRSDRKRRTFP